ncbi:alanine racemase [Paenibacillus sp. GP183]|uniref:alanine racemase n=1 Tax=Paenibacillus sp. GP183 TaxID=1882751 RepID=UPI000899C5D0|nr:alanine racemase [Paenibacillus sp. GP183]SEC61890.1 D-serine deaminase, pyridoxal phosphate-dependent [Paenibacillus sp. GP183]
MPDNDPKVMEQADLETPCLIIDTEKVKHNIKSMAEVISHHKVNLRPHAKTHKLPYIAHLQLQEGAVGITVAKVSEAEVMAQHGITNIFIAYPLVTPSKIERAIRLSERIELIIGVDSLEGALRVEATAAKHDHVLQVRLEIDTGLRRTGVLYEEALELAVKINSLKHLRLTGIFTFRGPILSGKPTLDIRAAGEEEGKLMVKLAEQIRAAGIPITDVSVGSSPTAVAVAAVEGITEVRPGTYVYKDRMQARYGLCSLDDCAGTMEVTVVSRPSPDLAIIDGGSKTFATDVQPGTEPLQLKGFGHVIELPDALLERLTEEHGMLRLGPSAQAANPRIGDRLHIIPNHICSTVNLHNRIILRSGDRFESVPVLGRGMLE